MGEGRGVVGNLPSDGNYPSGLYFGGKVVLNLYKSGRWSEYLTLFFSFWFYNYIFIISSYIIHNKIYNEMKR